MTTCLVEDLHIGDVVETAWHESKKYGRVVNVYAYSESSIRISCIAISSPTDMVGAIYDTILPRDKLVWVETVLEVSEEDATKAREALESLK